MLCEDETVKLSSMICENYQTFPFIFARVFDFFLLGFVHKLRYAFEVVKNVT